MSKLAPMCLFCKHYRGVDPKKDTDVCDAFPEGIPIEIMDYNYDHRLPFPNDKGIRLEPNPKYYPDINEFNKVADMRTTKIMPDAEKIKKENEEFRRLGIPEIFV